MAGIGIIIPGTGPGTGPVVPIPLPSPGVSGYTHRLSGQRLVGADGGTLATWADSGSTPVAPTISGAGTATINRTTQAFPYAVLNSMAAQFAGVGIVGGAAGTIAAIMGQSAFGSVRQFIAGFGYQIKMASSLQASNSGGSIASGLTAPSTSFGLVLIAFDGAGSIVIRVNGTEYTGTLTPQSTGIGALAVGVNNSGTVNNVAEFITWGTMLSSTQRAAVYTALKAAYPIIP